jgi:imidazolonepropionase-like amidohydrolase
MSTQNKILIENARVIDGLASAVVQADVLIEGDQIRAVGSAAQTLAGAHAQKINAHGLTLMPGLIDAHCHVTFDEPSSNDELFFHRREGLSAIIAAYNIRKVLRAGVTSVFDADCIFQVSIDLRDAIETGVTEGPRMTCGGNALFTSVGGTAGLLVPDEGGVGYSRVTRTRDEIVMEVRRQIKNGVDWIKVHVTGLIPRQKAAGEIQVWTLDELRTVADAAHALGIPVVGHCRNASSTRDAARAGFDMILHATYMDDEALEAVVDRKVPIVPTLTFQSVLAEHGRAVGASEDLITLFQKEIEGSSIMLRKAYDAGVPILCGTETGFSLTPYGEWHYREMQVLVDHMGLSPLQAIRCGTSESARALGLYGKTGAIAVGQLADMILVDGDPSQDIAVLGDKSRIKHVFLGGRSVDLSPLPPRTSISGWRVSPYSNRMLTWALAQEAQAMIRKAAE